jgi:FtsP/CotA-like multicopper oxidase with cupredoxin domain
MPIPSLTPFLDDLPIPPVIKPAAGKLVVDAKRVRVKLHSQLPGLGAWCWCYRHSVGTTIRPAVGLTYLGPTVEVQGHETVKVTWRNMVTGTLPLPVVKVDTASNGTGSPAQNTPGSFDAIPAGIVPLDPLRLKLQSLNPVLVTHLHGGSTQADYDGWPDNTVLYSQSVDYTYHNRQAPTMLWYHDHANHVTRTNVYAGLAGVWLIRDFMPDQPPMNMEEAALSLPSGAHEVPLVIQDRNLETNPAGTAFTGGLLHKTEINRGPAEFFGPFTLVNGKIWPKLAVAKGLYRFRVVNGSNARTYRLVLLDAQGKNVSARMSLIGNDQGLRKSIIVIPDTGLVLAPGERADVIINFAHKGAASKFYLWNIAESPFGDNLAYSSALNLSAELNGLISNPLSANYGSAELRPFPQVMRFDTSTSIPASAAVLPTGQLRASSPWSAVPTAGMKVRLMALVERPALTPQDTAMLVFWEYVEVATGTPNAIAFSYVHPVTSAPVTAWFLKAAEEFNDQLNWVVHLNTTELWYFVNLSPDTHPIHVHLVDMQVMDRRTVSGLFNAGLAYPMPPSPDPWSLDGNTDTLSTIDLGASIAVDFDQTDAKDTVRVNPREAIGVAMKFGPYCGKYMVHCHILEHEDSDMMRPFIVVEPSVPHHH